MVLARAWGFSWESGLSNEKHYAADLIRYIASLGGQWEWVHTTYVYSGT